MNFIVAAKRITTMLPVLLFVLGSSFLFTAGCKKSTSPPVAEPEPVTLQKAPAAGEEVHETEIHRNATVFISDFYSIPVPEIEILIEHGLKDSSSVIAYQDLHIAEAFTESEHLSLAASYDMKQVTHGVFIKPETFATRLSPAVDSSIPLYFQYPRSEDRVITHLKGEVTVISAGKTEIHTIQKLREFIQGQSVHPDLGTEIVKGFVYPSEFVAGLEAFEFTFRNGFLATEAKLLDAKHEELIESYPSRDVLPERRSLLRIESHLTPLDKNLSLQFKLHSDLSMSQIQFDLKGLQIPEIDDSILEQTDRKITGKPISVNLQRGIYVQASPTRKFSLVESINNEWQPKPYLEVQVEVFGEKLADTIAVGNLKKETAIAGSRSLVRTRGEYDLFSKLQRGLQLYMPDDYYLSPPVQGAVVSFPFELPPSSVKTIEEFSGDLTLVTAKSHEYLLIDNIMESLGEPLQHPTLKEHSIELTPVLLGDGINITVDPKHGFKVSEITAINASGATSTTIYSGRQQFGEKIVFSFHAEDKLPPVIPVRIRINHGLEEIRVPFEFKDLPIPEQIKADEN